MAEFQEYRVTLISIHALREEGDRLRCRSLNDCFLFLSTPSARRATMHHAFFGRVKIISIHALREEGDIIQMTNAWGDMISIHALREEGDSDIRPQYISLPDFYPRPPRGGRPLCDVYEMIQ